MLKVRHNLLISVTMAALILISVCAPVGRAQPRKGTSHSLQS